MLVDVRQYNTQYRGLCWLQDAGAAVQVLALPFKQVNVTAYYLDVDYDLHLMLPWSRRYLALMQNTSRVQTYGTCTQKCYLNRLLCVQPNSISDTVSTEVLQILSGKRVLKNYPISQYHMRHVTPSMIKDIVQRQPSLLKRLSRLNTLTAKWADEMSEATFCTLALYLLLLRVEDYNLISDSLLWKAPVSMKQWAKEVKNISIDLKAAQHTVDIDLTPFFELDVLLNRGLGGVNWEQERLNRTTQMQLTTHKYQDIYDTAAAMFRRSRRHGLKPNTLNWNKFWARRWEWATPGSVHTQHSRDLSYIDAQATKRTKWHTVCSMPSVSIDYWLKRKPETVAWPSVKYEWGKQRAIYGTDLTNYVLATFGFSGVEEILPPECPLGSHINEDTIRARVSKTVAGSTPYCLDFDDFNSQHSVPSMQAVIDAYLAVFSCYLSVEQIAACEWVKHALSDMTIVGSSCQKTGSSYKAKGTLLSGWRLTTFMNTVLNYCYVSIASKGLNVASLHSGDDVLLGVKSYSQVRTLEHRLRTMGCRLQSSKCFLGGLCEFLRVDHLHHGKGQYLARATSTTVHSPVETKKPYMLRAVLEAQQVRLAELRQRQGEDSVVDELNDLQLTRIGRFWEVSTSYLKDIIQTHRCLGGLSVAPDASLEHKYSDVKVSSDQEAANNSVAPGASDYAWELTRSLFTLASISHVARKAQHALDVVTGEATYTLAKQTIPEWIPDKYVLRAKYGCNRDRAGFAIVKLLAGMGLPIMSLRHTDKAALSHYWQYPANHRLDWMAVTV